MAFPLVRSIGEANSTSAVDPVIPFTNNVGDRVAIFLSIATAQTISVPAGWIDATNRNGNLHLIYRDLDGTEGTSVTVTLGTNAKFSAIIYHVEAGTFDPSIPPTLSTIATGTSNTPDPGNCNPGVAEDYLWITGFDQRGEEADDDTWCNSPPTDYGTLSQKTTGTGGTTASNCQVATADRSFNAASQDPGTFSTDQSLAWQAITIAIHPAPPMQTPEPFAELDLSDFLEPFELLLQIGTPLAGDVVAADDQVRTIEMSEDVDLILQGDDGFDYEFAAGARPPNDTFEVHVLTSDPDRWWRLGDAPASTQVVDETGNIPPGDTQVVGATLGVAGLIGGDPDTAARLDGSDDTIGMGDDAAPVEQSIVLWLRPLSSQADRGLYVKSSASSPPGPGGIHSPDIYLDGSGHVEARFWDGSAKVVTGSTVLVADTVYQIVVTQANGGQIHLYVNGVEEGTPVSIGTNDNADANFHWWGISSQANNYFHSKIDELIIYHRLLSRQEILDEYLIGSSGELGSDDATPMPDLSAELLLEVEDAVEFLQATASPAIDDAAVVEELAASELSIGILLEETIEELGTQDAQVPDDNDPLPAPVEDSIDVALLEPEPELGTAIFQLPADNDPINPEEDVALGILDEVVEPELGWMGWQTPENVEDRQGTVTFPESADLEVEPLTDDTLQGAREELVSEISLGIELSLDVVLDPIHDDLENASAGPIPADVFLDMTPAGEFAIDFAFEPAPDAGELEVSFSGPEIEEGVPGADVVELGEPISEEFDIGFIYAPTPDTVEDPAIQPEVSLFLESFPADEIPEDWRASPAIESIGISLEAAEGTITRDAFLEAGVTRDRVSGTILRTIRPLADVDRIPG